MTPAGSAPRLILASQSSARKAMIEAAGLEVTVRAARIDEEAVRQAARAEGSSPTEAALLLAGLKATRVHEPAALVVGADQILECEGVWFEKPKDLAAARTQLLALRGRRHVLHTAAVVHHDGAEIWRHIASPALTMRDFSDGFLEHYLALEADQVTASVGAYRLEGPGIQLFSRIDGDHTAILGLPLLPLLGLLRRHGVVPE